MTSEARDRLLETLKRRFEDNPHRHADLSWTVVAERISADPAKLNSLVEMERTGGEPDVVGRDDSTGDVLIFDCVTESPQGRRSLCYDRAALDARKLNKPAGAAHEMAGAMGIELLTEDQYRWLQTLEPIDLKTSSWISTPDDVRRLGGALFCDRRFGRVFVYHNGVESYYSGRGFRGCLRV